MGGLCSCFLGARDDVPQEVTPSSPSSLTNSNGHQHHVDTRVPQFFQRFGVESKSKSVQPETETGQSCSVEIADDQGTLDSSSHRSNSSEECPTCLENYTEENPKINAECSHHFHLPCILEWHQRSAECPNCREVLIVKGLIGEC